MDLNKLFGSKTKTDILKYLLFKRQGVSLRALENELTWSFPAIKKQVDVLLEAGVLTIDKNASKWSIRINDVFLSQLKELFVFTLKYELTQAFLENSEVVDKYFWGNLFGKNLGLDLVILHNIEKQDEQRLLDLKHSINEIFEEYFIPVVSVLFMNSQEWQKRYRLADRFVLSVIEKLNS